MIAGGSLGRKGARPHHVCPQEVALSELRATAASEEHLRAPGTGRAVSGGPGPAFTAAAELVGTGQAERERRLGESMRKPVVTSSQLPEERD